MSPGMAQAQDLSPAQHGWGFQHQRPHILLIRSRYPQCQSANCYPRSQVTICSVNLQIAMHDHKSLSTVSICKSLSTVSICKSLSAVTICKSLSAITSHYPQCQSRGGQGWSCYWRYITGSVLLGHHNIHTTHFDQLLLRGHQGSCEVDTCNYKYIDTR